MILFDQIVEVFDLSQFNPLGEHSSCFEISNRFGVGRVLIDANHSKGRRGGVGRNRGLVLTVNHFSTHWLIKVAV